MMLDLLLDQLFRDIAHALGAVADGPEAPTPVAILSVREFILGGSGRCFL